MVIIVNASTPDIAIDRAPRPPIGLFHEKNKRSKTGPRNTAGAGDMFPLRKRCLIALRFDVAILPATSCFTSRHCDWCDWSTRDGDDIERESGRSAGHRRYRQSSGEILGSAHAASHLGAPRGRRRRPRAACAPGGRATEGQGIKSLTSKQGPLAELGMASHSICLDRPAPYSSPQCCLAPFALQPGAPSPWGQRPGRRAAQRCERHPRGQAGWPMPARQAHSLATPPRARRIPRARRESPSSSGGHPASAEPSRRN
jgi:hypothetical protein